VEKSAREEVDKPGQESRLPFASRSAISDKPTKVAMKREARDHVADKAVVPKSRTRRELLLLGQGKEERERVRGGRGRGAEGRSRDAG